MLGKQQHRCSGLLTQLHFPLRSCYCRHCPRHACYVNMTATRLPRCVTAGNFLTSAINIKIRKADLVPWSRLIRTALGSQRRISLFRTPASYLGGPRGRLSYSIVHPHVQCNIYGRTQNDSFPTEGKLSAHIPCRSPFSGEL